MRFFPLLLSIALSACSRADAQSFLNQAACYASGTVAKCVKSVEVPSGGTGQTTLTNHGVLVGAGTSAITQLAVGTSGQLLVGSSAADPAFGSSVSAATTFSGGVVFNGGGTNLNFYEESTTTPSLSGATTSPSITVKLVRVGKTVTATIGVSGKVTKSGSNGPLSFSLPGSTDFTPATTQTFIAYGLNNNVAAATNWDASSTGVIEMWNGASGANIAANTTNVGWDQTVTFSYTVN